MYIDVTCLFPGGVSELFSFEFLAFKDDSFKQIAKVGIMGASLLSALIGMLWLGLTSSENK